MRRIIVLTAIFFVSVLGASPACSVEGKWPGVDESVVGKYAREYGRQPRDPLINTGQGDLLLFVFLLAGVTGGFAAGYYWRTLTDRRPKPEKGEKEET